MVSTSDIQKSGANNNWKDKPLTVLGLSRSGAAVARYVKRLGGNVFLSESLPASENNAPLRNELEGLGIKVEMGGHTAACYTHSDIVLTSPGIPPSGSILAELAVSGKTIWSEVELAYREAKQMSPAVPFIGITGTNGKSTTTTLVSDILQSTGLNAPACGNIGLPILNLLDEAQTKPRKLDYLVAELSSFQLHFSPTLTAKVAVFTNLTPDHLDWHGSLEGYEADKLKLFTGKQSPEWAVINASDPFSKRIIADTTAKILGFALDKKELEGYANKIYLNQNDITVAFEGQAEYALLNVKDLAIIGDHNYENVMAAAATALLLGLSKEQVKTACIAFEGLEHRLELVRLPDSKIRFYNDSKATNPESSISALKAFKTEPVIFIAGGYDKMTPLEPLAAELKKHAKATVLLGNARKRFEEGFEKAGISNIHTVEPVADSSQPALAPAIEKAIELSLELSKKNGDKPYSILFSPACSSFDMFKNYEERGRAFKETVTSITKTKTKELALS